MYSHPVENFNRNSNHLWAIVLAGGDGKRLEPFIRNRFGNNLPKQFCTFYGTRSMLSHTLSRVELLIPRNNIVVTRQHDHECYAMKDLKHIPQHNIAVQPMNRETGVGIVHALLRIYHQDPQALVAIFPSDHFIVEEKLFMEYVENGVAFIRRRKEYLLILGVEPDQPENEYGWIEPGIKITNVNGNIINRVNYFWEKPPTKQTIKLYENKYLWNTLVTISFADTLINRFCQLTPDIMVPMFSLRNYFYTPQEFEKTKAVFELLPSINFSYSILGKNVDGLSVLRMNNVHWSDWGDAQRIEKDIVHLNDQYKKSYCEV